MYDIIKSLGPCKKGQGQIYLIKHRLNNKLFVAKAIKHLSNNLE